MIIFFHERARKGTAPTAGLKEVQAAIASPPVWNAVVAMKQSGMRFRDIADVVRANVGEAFPIGTIAKLIRVEERRRTPPRDHRGIIV